RAGSRAYGLLAPAPVLVAAVTGAALFVLFTVTDGASLLPAGAVVAYWALFGATYLVLGAPGRDWQLPVRRVHVARLAAWARRGIVGAGRRTATVAGRALRAAEGRLPARSPHPSRQT
nr:hypothetical protein [Micromonospora sp. DSM 115978]